MPSFTGFYLVLLKVDGFLTRCFFCGGFNRVFVGFQLGFHWLEAGLMVVEREGSWLTMSTIVASLAAYRSNWRQLAWPFPFGGRLTIFFRRFEWPFSVSFVLLDRRKKNLMEHHVTDKKKHPTTESSST